MTLLVSAARRPQDPVSAEEAAEALRDSETGIAPDLLAEVAEAIRGTALGVMLYGSQARGSADESSDVDVLQVVSRHAGAYKVGRVAVTAYTPAHLHQMASHGSLFMLHLRTEGVVLEDAHGVVARALEAYRAPVSYNPLLSELRAAAEALAVETPQFFEYGQALGRLGIYLLRTSLYIEAAASASPMFDVDRAAAASGDAGLAEVLAFRRARVLSPGELQRVREDVLRRFDPPRRGLHFANLAVALSRTHPHASALVAQVIASGDSLDYAGLPLPPL